MIALLLTWHVNLTPVVVEHHDAPEERALHVEAEARTFMPTDVRLVAIEADARSLDVAAEARELAVDAENRRLS